MEEMLSQILDTPIWLVVLVTISAYIVVVAGLRKFLRPAIVNNLDPLNINLVTFLGPGIIGLVLSPCLTRSASESYFIILIFMCIWLFIVRITKKPRIIDLRDHMDANFQGTLLLIAVLLMVANIVINMIIPGKIPLLMTGGGLNSRFEATENSRLLVWLSFATTPMPGLIYSVTQKVRIRKMAAFAVALQMLTGLLFANKGAILTIVYILLNSLFIARARNDRTKYRTLRRKLIGCTLLVALVTPFYLAAIGAGTGSAAAGVIGIRLISGFDQLIITSNLNLLHRDGFSPLFKTNFFEYQLMPFFKALLSTHYDHSSIGQYVIETLRGTTIEGRGTYPNSNLILETIFTSGKYFGALFFILELAAFYWGRRISLGIPITPLSLVLVQTFVLAPYGLFLSGQDWINQAVIAFVTVIVALVVSKFWNAIVKSSRSSFNRNRDSQISYATHSRPRTPSQESQIE